MNVLTRGVLLLICLMQAACATGSGLREEFDRSVKTYNKMLRWHEIESAGMTYVDPDQLELFQKQAEDLKKRGLSVTEFRILTAQFNREKDTGDVVAEFDYFILPSNRIKTVSYHQKWSYRTDLKGWKLTTVLPDFE
jgi:hypothetical protein